jgi:inner membrane protein
VLFGLSLLGIYAHIFFDLITSYGTQIFFPFSDKRYSLDLVFIIDFYFTSLLLIPLIIMKFKKGWARILALSSVAGVLIYLGAVYIERGVLIEKIKTETGRFGIKSANIEAIPLPLSPFKWSVFVEDDKRFHQINTDILKYNMTINSFEKKLQGNNNIIGMVENLEIVKTYLWFARFPVVTVKEQDSGYLVEYFDLRFNSLPPRKPFLLSLFLDKNGSLNHAELMFHTIK